MDKQKDFEKGWEEYKAKKKQMIEEMEKVLYNYRFSYDDCIAGSETDLAKFLVNRGWIKPAENAVVLTREEYEKLLDVRTDVILKDIDKVFKEEFEDTKRSVERKIKPIYKAIETRTRKETAEKFAERLKEKLEENSPIAGYDLEDLEFDGETIQECIDEIAKEMEAIYAKYD